MGAHFSKKPAITKGAADSFWKNPAGNLWGVMNPNSSEKYPIDHLLSPESLAAKLDCSVKHARALMANGILPKIRLGRRCVRTSAAAVEEFIARRTVSSKEK